MSIPVFLQRVILQNYKSIGHCDVRLHSLTWLVGGNGAGKSNFLDALQLVSDALNGSLDNALNERGGINEVRRAPAATPPTSASGWNSTCRMAGRDTSHSGSAP